MREIVLDTETTGLSPSDGHRMVEVGAVELVNHLPTGNELHFYVNPERPMPDEAKAVHGLDDAFLAGQPRFGNIVERVLEFLGNAPLVIHNAEFDMRFLNAELVREGRAELPGSRAIDTLALARERLPGSPASLDALCRRFGVDNRGRETHGALLDSRLLAEVYLELIGGRQPGLHLSQATFDTPHGATRNAPTRRRDATLSARLTDAEEAAHRALVAELGPDSLWARIESGSAV